MDPHPHGPAPLRLAGQRAAGGARRRIAACLRAARLGVRRPLPGRRAAVTRSPIAWSGSCATGASTTRAGIGRLAAAVVRGDGPGALAALEDHSDGAYRDPPPLPDPAAFERLAAPARGRTVRAVAAGGAGAAQGRPTPDAPERMAKPLSSFRVLCAHRVGSFGAERFNRAVERRLRALDLVRPRPGAFYPGRPLLVTRNDPRTGLANGDAGVVLRDTAGRAQVWFPELTDAAGRPRPRLASPPPSRTRASSPLPCTGRRASEYDEVAVVPRPGGRTGRDPRAALYRGDPRTPPGDRIRRRGERHRRRRAHDRTLLRPPRRPRPPPEPALTEQDAGSRKTRSRAVSG